MLAECGLGPISKAVFLKPVDVSGKKKPEFRQRPSTDAAITLIVDPAFYHAWSRPKNRCFHHEDV